MPLQRIWTLLSSFKTIKAEINNEVRVVIRNMKVIVKIHFKFVAVAVSFDDSKISFKWAIVSFIPIFRRMGPIFNLQTDLVRYPIKRP